MESLAGELEAVDVEGQPAWVLAAGVEAAGETAHGSVRLLPQVDSAVLPSPVVCDGLPSPAVCGGRGAGGEGCGIASFPKRHGRACLPLRTAQGKL